MTPEQLLIPRFKVIADYPGCTWNVGDIYSPTGEENLSNMDSHGCRLREKIMSSYPHLFKKLEWWEDRKPEEIQYVKRGAKIWECKYEFGNNTVTADGYCFTMRSFMKDTSPATKEEYEQQQAK